jgi:ATP adenylyltransferase
MKFLSAPWRWDFISKITGKEKCIFCDALASSSNQKSLVCYRGRNFFVILNKYPYSSGHLMVVPNKHIDSLAKISSEESMEMWDLIKKAVQILKKRFNPSGFNLGMNVGKAAGAGVKDHIHLHIVPRWEGDANFMPVIGKTKVMSYDMNTIFRILLEEFSL